MGILVVEQVVKAARQVRKETVGLSGFNIANLSLAPEAGFRVRFFP